MKDYRLSGGNIGQFTTELMKLVLGTKKTYRVNVVEWREKRSLSQNSLYWKWVAEINKQSPLRVENSNLDGSELWHEVFKKYYCPVKNITNQENILPVKSTKLLDVGEMTFYLNKIEHWAIDRGLTLTIPEDSEYANLMRSQSE